MSGAGYNDFSPWDYVVFSLVLAISAGIGVFYGCFKGGQKTTKTFLMADRSMSVFPVTLSLLASFMSAITLLGTPAEIYRFGTQYWVIWVGYLIMIPLAAEVYIPIFFKLRFVSVFEYLEKRFNRTIRIMCCITYILQMAMYMAIVLYAPSLALSAVTGLNVWISVFSVGVICTFYTALGGMKAVMWTDTFQIIIMFAGLISVLIQGSIDQGGFTNIWNITRIGQRIEFFNFDPNPLERHTVWSLVFGGAFTWLAIYGVNQAQVQRAMTVPKLSKARLAMWLNLPGLTALLTVCALAGLVVYAEYRDCDPLTTKRITAADQLLPLYVMDRLGQFKGLPGLFTASLFSGALSTISSGLNSLSAITLTDLIRTLCYTEMSETRATTVSKILSLVYGVICIALTFVAANLGGVLQAALALFGMLGGPQLGVFTLGILYPCANGKGAVAGFLASIVLTLWLGIGAQIYKPTVYKPPVSVAGCFLNMTTTTMGPDVTTPMPPIPISEKAGYLAFYEISYMWYSAFAVLVVCVVGLVVSFITGRKKPGEVDSRLLYPFFERICCCCPGSIRKFLRWNVDYSEPMEDEDEYRIKGAEKQLEMTVGYDNPVYPNPVLTMENGFPANSTQHNAQSDNAANEAYVLQGNSYDQHRKQSDDSQECTKL